MKAFTTRGRNIVTGTAAMAAFLGALVSANDAQACGGLFCSAAAPVNQTAERIVFATDGDGSVDMIVEVQYQGPSEEFGWLLPMPGTPEVGVSDRAVLDAIDLNTEPQYRLEYDYGECTFPDYYGGDDAVFEAAPPPSVEDDEGAPVEVLDQGNAGPYDYITIRPNPDFDDPAQVGIDWLVEQGFDVGDIGADVLRPYLAQDLNLVAFRLTKGNDVGAIRPVMLRYEGDTPSIPIGPTAVAAAEDMGVRVFVLGETRSVSNNYLSLELNDARINWFNWRVNYDEVVSAAADEAGGHGFVTEYAGDTGILADKIWDPYTQERWEALQSFTGSNIELIWEARFPFRRFEGFRRAVEAATTLPDGVTMDEFAASPLDYEGQATVDRELFMATMQDDVITPLQDAQVLVDAHPMLSRLYTTLSPEEMVVDPTFVYNPDLPEVSNIHEAMISFECSGDIMYVNEAPWKITLPDGNTISGLGDGRWNEALDDLPAAATITQVGAVGEGDTMSNRDDIAEMLGNMPDPTPPEPTDPAAVDDPVDEADDVSDPTDDEAITDEGTADEADDEASDEAADDEDEAADDDDEAADDDDAAEDDDASEDASGDAGADDEDVTSDDKDKKDKKGCSVASVGSSSPAPGGALASLMLLGVALLNRRRRS